MNERAFYEGLGEGLRKEAFFGLLAPWVAAKTSLALQNAQLDATNELLNSQYAGVAQANPDGSFSPNWINLARSQLPGGGGYTPPPAKGLLGKVVRYFGPNLRSIANPQLVSRSGGMLSSPSTNTINIDKGKVVDTAWNGIKDFASKNQGKLLGGGLLALGGMALLGANRGNNRPTTVPQTASPAGQQPAPFTNRRQDNFYASDREEG